MPKQIDISEYSAWLWPVDQILPTAFLNNAPLRSTFQCFCFSSILFQTITMDTPTISYDDFSLSGEDGDPTTQTNEYDCSQPPLKKRKLDETLFLAISSEDSGPRRSSRRPVANPRFKNPYLEEPSRPVAPVVAKASFKEKKAKFALIQKDNAFFNQKAADLVSHLSFSTHTNK